MPATFHFYIREDRPNKQGLCPIYLKITHNRKRKYLNTGIKLSPSEWNTDKQQVRRNHRTYNKLNDELDIIRAEAEQAYRDLKRNKQVNADSIKKRMEYSSKDNFFDIAEEYQREIKENSYYTWKQNRVAIEKVKKFHGSDYLPFSHIDISFLSGLVSFMQGKPYFNKPSTIHKNFGAIRAILDKAVTHKLLPENPMDSKEFSLPKNNGSTSKTKLSFKQIQAIEELSLQPGSNIWNARNAFILSYYFCGMRFGDLSTLRWDNVENGRLRYIMSKTGNEIDVKIPEGAQKILSLYDGDDLILPFLSRLSDRQREDNELVRRSIQSNNAIVNDRLKEIAKMAGIKEKISMHVSRHSFAQFAIEEKDIPAYRLMILLGHQNIKTTMQYLKTINVKVADETMDEIF